MYAWWGYFFTIGGNYIEHYGIMRMKDKNGIYESISHIHSWNSVSSAIFFKIQRHSDHHVASFRPYQILRRYDHVPWYPFQFIACFWVGIIPPFWFYCINPRCDAIRDIQLGKKDNPTCYDNYSALTKHDAWIKKVVWVYMFILTIVFGYFSFFSNTFRVF